MRLGFILFFACLASVAHAENCDPNAVQDQSTMNACAFDDYKKADKELNSVYGAIVGRMKDDAAAKELLKKAQKSWVAFRDAECLFRASPNEGGSIYPLVQFGCAASLTKARVSDLKANYLD
jgi:uncharacterized protein YecT (DUF1311 family)